MKNKDFNTLLSVYEVVFIYASVMTSIEIVKNAKKPFDLVNASMAFFGGGIIVYTTYLLLKTDNI